MLFSNGTLLMEETKMANELRIDFISLFQCVN